MLGHGTYTQDGRTALHLSALYGHRGATYQLVQFRSNLNARDHQLMTPLHMAGQRGHAGPVYPILKGTTWTLDGVCCSWRTRLCLWCGCVWLCVLLLLLLLLRRTHV